MEEGVGWEIEDSNMHDVSLDNVCNGHMGSSSVNVSHSSLLKLFQYSCTVII